MYSLDVCIVFIINLTEGYQNLVIAPKSNIILLCDFYWITSTNVKLKYPTFDSTGIAF